MAYRNYSLKGRKKARISSMLPPRVASRRDLFVPPAPDRGGDAQGIIHLGEMVTPLYDDGTVPGKELLEATQPPHFDCTILGEDQQRWHLLLRSSCLTVGRRASVVGLNRCSRSAR